MTPPNDLDTFSLWLHPHAPINMVLALIDAWPGAAILAQETPDGLRLHHVNAAAGRRLKTAAECTTREATAERLLSDGAFRRLSLDVDAAPVLLVETRHQEGDRHERQEQLSKAWRLSPRQAEVLQWVVRGETNKGIAQRLAISVSMVEQHLSELYRKAGAESRPALVAAFWDHDAGRERG